MPATAWTTEPPLFVFKRPEETEVMARFEVVAAEPVAVVYVNEVKVEEALEMKPLLKARVVEVAFSPVPNLMNG